MLSWSFVSCDKCIYEDLSSCPLRVQLRYDYNMQYVCLLYTSMQIVEQIPLEPWDVTMHYIISDSKTYEVRD